MLSIIFHQAGCLITINFSSLCGPMRRRAPSRFEMMNFRDVKHQYLVASVDFRSSLNFALAKGS